MVGDDLNSNILVIPKMIISLGGLNFKIFFCLTRGVKGEGVGVLSCRKCLMSFFSQNQAFLACIRDIWEF